MFWFRNIDFNIEDINLGHFKDIVSVGASDPNYFSICFIESNEKKDGPKNITAFLLTFANREGILQPLLFAYSNGKNEFRFRLTPNQRGTSIGQYLNTLKSTNLLKRFIMNGLYHRILKVINCCLVRLGITQMPL
jgi:hypothetical protein